MGREEERDKKIIETEYSRIDPVLMDSYRKLIEKKARSEAERIFSVNSSMSSEEKEAALQKREKQYQAEFDKRYYNSNTSKVIRYLNTLPQEQRTEEKLEFVFNRQNSFLSIISEAVSRSDFDVTRDVLDAPNFKNLYGAKTDVTQVSSYDKGGWYKTHLDGMQTVQLDIPEGLSEKEVMLINVGEFLNEKNVLPVGSFISDSDDKGTMNASANSTESQYYAYLAQHLFVPTRDKEWGNLLVGRESRERTKQVLDNFRKDPKKAAEDLEKVFNTSYKYALNISTWDKSKVFAVMAAEAYEALQNPLLAPYSTLGPEAKEMAETIKGRILAREKDARSASTMCDLRFKAKLNEEEDKLIKDDPAAKKAFEDYVTDRYIGNMLTTTDLQGTKYSSIHDDPRCAHSKLEVMLGKNPEITRELIKDSIKKDPAFAKLAEKVSFDNCSKLTEDYTKKNAPAGYRFVTADPGTMRRNLEAKAFDYAGLFRQEIEPSTEIKKSDKSALRKAINGFEEFKNAFMQKNSYSAEDLKEFRGQIEMLSNTTAGIYSSYGDNIPTPIAEVYNMPRTALDNIDQELAFHKKLGPAADKAEARINAEAAVDENIDYQQERLKLALDHADKLKADYADFKAQKESGSLTAEKAEKQQKNLDSQIRAVNRSVKNACAGMIANNTVRMMMASAKEGLNAPLYRKLTDPEEIGKMTKDIENSAAFKEFMKNMDTNTLRSLTGKKAEPGKKNEALEKLCRDFRAELPKHPKKNPVHSEKTKEQVNLI